MSSRNIHHISRRLDQQTRNAQRYIARELLRAVNQVHLQSHVHGKSSNFQCVTDTNREQRCGNRTILGRICPANVLLFANGTLQVCKSKCSLLWSTFFLGEIFSDGAAASRRSQLLDVDRALPVSHLADSYVFAFFSVSVDFSFTELSVCTIDDHVPKNIVISNPTNDNTWPKLPRNQIGDGSVSMPSESISAYSAPEALTGRISQAIVAFLSIFCIERVVSHHANNAKKHILSRARLECVSVCDR